MSQTCKTDKLSWKLCSFFSVIYLLAFLQRALLNGRYRLSTPIKGDGGLTDGFCVWADPTPWPERPPGPNEKPQPFCSNKNSHEYAWFVDVGMTVIVLALLGFKMKKSHAPQEKSSLQTWMFASVAVVIILHGVLHHAISLNGCMLTRDVEANHSLIPFVGLTDYSSSDDRGQTLMRSVAYIIYVTMLVASDICFAFPEIELHKKLRLIAILSAATFAVTFPAGAKWALSALFAVSHPLVSFSGLFSKASIITPSLGWTFLAATLAGTVEFLFCENFLKIVGGHVWYDFFLHVSMISVLPIFPQQQHAADLAAEEKED